MQRASCSHFGRLCGCLEAVTEPGMRQPSLFPSFLSAVETDLCSAQLDMRWGQTKATLRRLLRLNKFHNGEEVCRNDGLALPAFFVARPACLVLLSGVARLKDIYFLYNGRSISLKSVICFIRLKSTTKGMKILASF